eukprot:scaffold9137_cov21-Tisochrysis_lutea.AAC.2
MVPGWSGLGPFQVSPDNSALSPVVRTEGVKVMTTSHYGLGCISWHAVPAVISVLAVDLCLPGPRTSLRPQSSSTAASVAISRASAQEPLKELGLDIYTATKLALKFQAHSVQYACKLASTRPALKETRATARNPPDPH